jgi:hypothetical protein
MLNISAEYDISTAVIVAALYTATAGEIFGVSKVKVATSLLQFIYTPWL